MVRQHLSRVLYFFRDALTTSAQKLATSSSVPKQKAPSSPEGPHSGMPFAHPYCKGCSCKLCHGWCSRCLKPMAKDCAQARETAEREKWEREMDTLKSKLQAARAAKARLQGELEAVKRQEQCHASTCPRQCNEWLLSDKAFSDLTIIAQGAKLEAHVAMLTSRSPVFAAMLTSPCKEATERVLEISDMSSDAVQQLLHFIYCGSFNRHMNTAELAAEVHAAADKYEIEGLQELLLPLMRCLPESFDDPA